MPWKHLKCRTAPQVFLILPPYAGGRRTHGVRLFVRSQGRALRYYSNESGHVIVCARDGEDYVAFAYAKASLDGSLLFTTDLDLNSEDEGGQEWEGGPVLDRLKACALEKFVLTKADITRELDLESHLEVRLKDAVARSSSNLLRRATRYALAAGGLDAAKRAFDQALIESVIDG